MSCRVGGLEVKVLLMEREASVHGHVSVTLSSLIRCKTWPVPCLCGVYVCCKRVCALCDLASAHKLNLHQVLSVLSGYWRTHQPPSCTPAHTTINSLHVVRWGLCLHQCARRMVVGRLCGRTAGTLRTPCWCFSLSRFPSRF